MTVSSSRTLAEDESGRWMEKHARKEGHEVAARVMVDDDRERIAGAVLDMTTKTEPNLIIITGGTGLTPKDVTIEAVRPLFSKEMTAFGVLFAMLSFEQIDAGAILSRATAGVIGKTAVFCIPGSLEACKLACKALIFPEAGHVASHIIAD